MGLVAGACGNPSFTAGDAGVVGDGESSDGTSIDAPEGDAIDAPIGVLSPDPSDPVSLPCSGMLGFPGAPMLTPSGQAYHLLIADVNGDGIADIVSNDLSKVGIAQGNGDGTFDAQTFTTIPGNSRAFRVVDVSGDGKPDLVTGALQQHNIQVSLNNGIGGFGPPQSYDPTVFIEQLEVLDLNGDGRSDLVGLATSGERVVVLLNTGSSFSTAQTYSAASQSTFQMAVGDITGDNRPDIVVSSQSGTVNVLANTGSGAFAQPVAYTTPFGPWGIALVDLDEDGKLDVAVGAETNRPVVSVLLNQGGGVLGAAVSYPAGAPGYAAPRVLGVADVNGDGHLDIGTAYTLEESSSLLLGNGTGQLGSSILLAIDAQPSDLAFGDLNGDGRAELVLLTLYAITPYLNNGTASPYDMRTRHQFGVAMTNTGVRMIDLNGDGRLDLVGMGETGFTAPIVPTRLATGGGSFSSQTTSYLPDMTPHMSALADLNNDSRQDLLLFGRQPTMWAGKAMLNQGNGTLSAAATFNPSLQGIDVAIGDINGDGWRDLIIPDFNPSNDHSDVHYVRGLGNGQFAAGTVVWSGRIASGVAVLDLDGDSKLDLVIHHYGNGPQRDILLGLGNATFTAPTQTTWPEYTTNLAVRDFNSDGRPDVVGFLSMEIVVMLGNGDGTLAPPLRSPGPRPQTGPAFADLNGDGRLDMVTGSGLAVAVHLGGGDGTFRAPVHYNVGAGLRTVSVGDVDGDGRVDILVNNERDRVSVLPGRCL